MLAEDRRMRRQISTITSATAIAAAALLQSGGCRHADLNRELVERELRLQEDELYRLHDEVASREKLLESTRRENAVLKRELEQARVGAPPPRDIIPDMPPAPTDTQPERAPRPDSGIPPAQGVPPVIEIPGAPGGPPSARAPADRSSWKSTRGVRRASFESPLGASSDEEGPAVNHDADDDQVAKLVLNRRLTGGFNADRRLGDEGVIVVIEPRDHRDRLVERPGEVSVAIIDPALSSEAARIGRWDFTADEIARLFAKTPRGEGIQLNLRWPAGPPEHERLVVFVRYTTAEGDRFEASQSILIDLARDSQVDVEAID
jgi:hypothetical protein